MLKKENVLYFSGNRWLGSNRCSSIGCCASSPILWDAMEVRHKDMVCHATSNVQSLWCTTGNNMQSCGVLGNNVQTVWCTTGITGTDLALLKQTGASAWDTLSLDCGWRVNCPAHISQVKFQSSTAISFKSIALRVQLSLVVAEEITKLILSVPWPSLSWTRWFLIPCNDSASQFLNSMVFQSIIAQFGLTQKLHHNTTLRFPEINHPLHTACIIQKYTI